MSLLHVLQPHGPPSLASAGEALEEFVENPVSGATAAVGFQEASQRFRWATCTVPPSLPRAPSPLGQTGALGLACKVLLSDTSPHLSTLSSAPATRAAPPLSPGHAPGLCALPWVSASQPAWSFPRYGQRCGRSSVLRVTEARSSAIPSADLLCGLE